MGLESEANFQEDFNVVPPEPKLLSEKEIQRLIYQSFWFSQGNSSLQKFLFDWLSFFYGKQPEFHKHIGLALDYFIKRTFKRTTNTLRASLKEPFGGNHVSVSSGWFGEFEKDMTKFCGKLTKNNTEAPEKTLSLILENMITSDFKYSQKGRPRKPTSDPKKLNNPRLDPNFSFFVHYILRGGRCPEPAFAGAFDEIRNHFPVVLSFSKERIFSESDLKNKLQTIFAAYNAAPHHQQKITQAELDRTGWGLRLEK